MVGENITSMMPTAQGWTSSLQSTFANVDFTSLINKLTDGIATVLAMITKLFGNNVLIIMGVSLLLGFIIGKASTWSQTLKLKLLIGFLLFLVIKFAMEVAK